jgi:hypothetical protein
VFLRRGVNAALYSWAVFHSFHFALQRSRGLLALAATEHSV